jgi:hypothetical protein
MVSSPIRSWVRPAAVVSGGVAMVCLTGAWHAPISTHPTPLSATPAAGAVASGAAVRLVAEVTSLRPGWPAASGPGGGLGGAPGGGSGGSPGDAVAPSPTRHQADSGSSSSTSAGSTNRQASSPHSTGPVQTAFNTVGRWLGLSHDSPSSSDSSTTDDSTTAMPKQVKPASTGAGGAGKAADKSSTTSSASGVSDMIHSVVSGVGRLMSNLFGH